jgi:hypothetical protein
LPGVIIWSVLGTLEVVLITSYFALNLLLTSHLGDSGMKNRPGINNVQGKVPERMDAGDLNQKSIVRN